MISKDRLEQALHYIATTDKDFAETKTEVERATYLCKHVRAIQYELTEGSVDERKSAVERSQPVQEAEERRIKAIGAHEYCRAKRETEQLIIDVWRSLEATRRRETVI